MLKEKIKTYQKKIDNSLKVDNKRKIENLVVFLILLIVTVI